jgi:hypothetical protein
MSELLNNPYNSRASWYLEAFFLCNMMQHAPKHFQAFPGMAKTSMQHERDMVGGVVDSFASA